MSFSRAILFLALGLLAFSGCGTSSSSTTSQYISGPNVLQITVDGSLCNSNTMYVNEPCASITVCTPGTSQCQTINNILVDTGSYGLRIFSSVLTSVTPSAMTDGSGNQIAECMTFGSGSTWGPVKQVGLEMASEPEITVPIQVINSNYATRPGGCSGSESSPSVGFNGILGVGPLRYDCGSLCASTASNSVYYSCNGSGTCSGAQVATDNQVQNPVALLPVDNNGVIIEFPSIGLSGESTVNGGVVFGIGTESNNTPNASNFLQANSSGDFVTSFNSTNYTTSIFDTGSNGVFFPSTMTQCSSTTWFCPNSTTNLSATLEDGTRNISASFAVANYLDLLNNTSSAVFPDVGAYTSGDFTWGLPYFFGRNIYFGIEGTTSSLGTGPYYAY